MPKNIILCSDGTGNISIKGRGTNVFKMFEAIDLHNPRTRQIAYYDDGVGTSKFKPLMILGGAFGLGLSRNVRQLYTELVRSYEPGDKIYLFGFSRGAFTVRNLAGFINAAGIFDRNKVKDDVALRRSVRTAYRLYRQKQHALLSDILYYTVGQLARLIYHFVFRIRCQASTIEDFRKQYSVKPGKGAMQGRVPIEFIGVWDTVSAVGLPVRELALFVNYVIYSFEFNNHDLGVSVKRACQALSLDDERKTFHPLLWDESNETKKRIEQVWFAGVHSNVGGGYNKQGMSLVAMKWMLEQARKSGLLLAKTDLDHFISHGNVHDKLFDSRSGFAIYYRYAPRNLYKMCTRYGIAPRLHESILDRIIQMSDGYAPGNVPRNVEFVPEHMTAKQLQVVARKIKGALQDKTSLLRDVRLWSVVRRHAHHLLLGFTLLAVYFIIIQYGSTPTGMMDSLMGEVSNDVVISKESLVAAAIDVLKSKPWLFIAILMVYGVARFGRWRIHRVFSEFWYKLIPALK